jgi:REP element-mobilizing transposase RayT
MKSESAVERPSKNKHGGRRHGAGRKRSGPKTGGAHRKRPALSSQHPVQLTWRTVRDLPRLRQRCFYEALRRVLVRYLAGDDFRVVHISIQHNHLHLLVEAANAKALTQGAQSFAINAARAINAAWGRGGKVFAYRYHQSQIKTGRHARNALSYVLNNWRRHREDFFDGAARAAKLDEYSSAICFDGWTTKFRRPPDYEPLPVSPPRTQLLAVSWRLYGLIDWAERPGPLW